MRCNLDSRAVPTPLGADFRGPDGRIGYLLRQAQHALWMAIESALAPLGITASQFGVLRLVEVCPGATGAELAHDSMYSPQSTHEMLVTLEGAGLIERRRDPGDRRVRRTWLTPAGVAALAESHRRVIAIEDRMMAGLSEPDRRRLRGWLVTAAEAAAATTETSTAPAG
jgi:DNA-binding MarR family transcriptional regulator